MRNAVNRRLTRMDAHDDGSGVGTGSGAVDSAAAARIVIDYEPQEIGNLQRCSTDLLFLRPLALTLTLNLTPKFYSHSYFHSHSHSHPHTHPLCPFSLFLHTAAFLVLLSPTRLSSPLVTPPPCLRVQVSCEATVPDSVRGEELARRTMISRRIA